jgi:hypothetical protein
MFVYRSDYNVHYRNFVGNIDASALTEALLIEAHAYAARHAAVRRMDVGISPRHTTWRASGNGHDHGGGDCMCWEDACLACGRGIRTGFQLCEVCWHFEGASPTRIVLDYGAIAIEGAHPTNA